MSQYIKNHCKVYVHQSVRVFATEKKLQFIAYSCHRKRAANTIRSRYQDARCSLARSHYRVINQALLFRRARDRDSDTEPEGEICERTRLSAVARISSLWVRRSLLFPRAYVGHVFTRNTFEDIDRRVSPSVAVAAAAAAASTARRCAARRPLCRARNYSYSLFGRGVHRTKTFPRDVKREEANRKREREKEKLKGEEARKEGDTRGRTVRNIT